MLLAVFYIDLLQVPVKVNYRLLFFPHRNKRNHSNLCMFSSDCIKTSIKLKGLGFFFPHIFQKAATIWGLVLIQGSSLDFLQIDLTAASFPCIKWDSTAGQRRSYDTTQGIITHRLFHAMKILGL